MQRRNMSKQIVDWAIVVNYDKNNQWGVVNSDDIEILTPRELGDYIMASVDSYLHDTHNSEHYYIKKGKTNE